MWHVNASSRTGNLGTHPSLHPPKWESLEKYYISQTFQLFLQQGCTIFNPFLCILGNSPHLMRKRFHCYLMHSQVNMYWSFSPHAMIQVINTGPETETVLPVMMSHTCSGENSLSGPSLVEWGVVISRIPGVVLLGLHVHHRKGLWTQKWSLIIVNSWEVDAQLQWKPLLKDIPEFRTPLTLDQV